MNKKYFLVLYILLYTVVCKNSNAQRINPPNTIINNQPSNQSYGQLPNGSFTPLQLDSNGNLYVTGVGGGSGGSNAAAGPLGNTSQFYGGLDAFLNSNGALTAVAPSNPLPVNTTVTNSPSAFATSTINAANTWQTLFTSAPRGCSITNANPSGTLAINWTGATGTVVCTGAIPGFTSVLSTGQSVSCQGAYNTTVTICVYSSGLIIEGGTQ